jgi:hypothetical protein
MKRSTTLTVGIAAVLILGVAIAATAQPERAGPAMVMHGMGDGPMGLGMVMHGIHPGVGDGSSGPMRGPPNTYP